MFLDLGGDPVDEPDGIVIDGLHDARYRERVPAFIKILNDRSNPPWERFLACYVLVAWGNEEGYREVVRVASDPASEPWVGTSRHQLWGVVDTFRQLLEAIDISEAISVENDTQSFRIDALRALIRLLPDWYVEGALSLAVQSVIAVVKEDLTAAIEVGLQRLRNRDLPDFDLARQLAVTVSALLDADEESTCALATELLRMDRSWEVKQELFSIVRRGQTPASRRFARTLALKGGPRTWASVTEALANRTWRRRGPRGDWQPR